MVMNVLIADDHCLMREGLKALLQGDGNLRVVGEAADGQAAVDAVRDNEVDVALVDILMPGMDGVEATRQIKALKPAVKVVALTAMTERRYAMQMLEAGASAYVLKDADCEELRRAIDAAARGQSYLSPAVASSLVQGFVGRGLGGKAGGDELASRERQVLQLLAEGQTSAQIATELGIAPSTVETHRRNIMKKLDIHSVAELTKYALRHGLTSL